MSNIFAFSDIHGEFFKLKGVIEKLPFDKEDMFIFLGDYIDRGKYSFEVVDYLIEFSKKYKCIFLKGNHEAMFAYYMVGIDEDLFIANSGKKTINSYYKNSYNIKQSRLHLDRRMPVSHSVFFMNLNNYYETDNYIFVHAGITPGIPLDSTPIDTLLWDRDFYNNNNYDGKTVVFGHTPSHTIMNTKNKICIDTAACFGKDNPLTCVKLPDRVFFNQGGACIN